MCNYVQFLNQLMEYYLEYYFRLLSSVFNSQMDVAAAALGGILASECSKPCIYKIIRPHALFCPVRVHSIVAPWPDNCVVKAISPTLGSSRRFESLSTCSCPRRLVTSSKTVCTNSFYRGYHEAFLACLVDGFDATNSSPIAGAVGSRVATLASVER